MALGYASFARGLRVNIEAEGDAHMHRLVEEVGGQDNAEIAVAENADEQLDAASGSAQARKVATSRS